MKAKTKMHSKSKKRKTKMSMNAMATQSLKNKKPKKSGTTKDDTDQNSDDIIRLIMDDHKALKKFITILKDSESELDDRKKAFKDFSLMLTTHANAEKESLYKILERNENLAKKGFEGEVVHSLALQTLEAAIDDERENAWSAKTKVLAELVEYHIKAEESDMLPEYRKQSSSEERLQAGEKYLMLKMKNQHYENQENETFTEEEDSDSRKMLDHEISPY